MIIDELTIRTCPKDYNRQFSLHLIQLHYASNCLPTGRYMRFILEKKSNIIGGFILRSTIPHVTNRDIFFNIYKFRIRGRIPNSTSEYWKILNKIPNMARAFILKKYQGKGFGIKMMRMLENVAIPMWEENYQDTVVGIDCMDIVPPDDAKIFLQNSWVYLGETKGYSKKNRKPFGGPNRDQDNPIIGKLEKINPKWHIYAKKL